VERKEINYITTVGNWDIFKVPNVSPEEFIITNSIRKFFNLKEESAIRLAELLDAHDKDNLEPA
jgi:hypothetical protein